MEVIMKATLVTDGIYMLSINVENLLFEEMWDIPKGVTVNSYIVKGEKTAIIDGVCGWDGVPETLFELLDQIDVKPEDIDYLVVNHMEPDHSGWIEDFKKITDKFEIYCTGKAAELLDAFYQHDEKVHVVKNGDAVDLGGGKRLLFNAVPNVHWPDTMMTFEEATGTLFTCDMFGSFGKLDERHFDDQMTEEDHQALYDEEIRYFSNVLSTFNKPAAKAIKVARGLEPKIVAPGHGPIYRQTPTRVFDKYEAMVNFREGKPLQEITLLWGSMYGMTEKAVKKIEALIEKAGITVHSLHLPHAQMSEILSKTIRSAGVIIAAPTYENKLFPNMAATLDELGRKKIMPKKAIYVGSYGWAGGGKREVEEIIERNRMKWELLDTVEFKGSPTDDDLGQVEVAVETLIKAIKQD